MKHLATTITILFLFIASLAFAQEKNKAEGRPLNGPYKERFANGKKSVKGKYRDGQKTGRWKSWYSTGQLHYTEHYRLDKREGAYTEFYVSGKKKQAGNYRNGKEDGLWNEWHENGQKSAERTYADGKLEGSWTQWSSEGKMATQESYRLGQKDGEQRYWYPNGQLLCDQFFKEGKLNGTSLFYDSLGRMTHSNNNINDSYDGLQRQWKNGKLIVEEEYKLGDRHGFYHSWNEKGDTLEWSNYKNGLRDGLSVKWKRNKRLSEERYVAGRLEGLSTYYDPFTTKLSYKRWLTVGKPDSLVSYYPNGQMKSHVGFNVEGLREGSYSEWAENGKPLVTGYYMKGLKQFIWKVYYPDGSVKSLAAYQFGKLEQTYSRLYPNGRRMLVQEYKDNEPVGKAKIWNEKGVPLKPGTPEYEAIRASSLPDETFVDEPKTPRGMQPLTDNTPVSEIATPVQEPEANPVFTVVEEQPVFTGDPAGLIAYIGKNLQYPANSEAQGTVYISLTIEEDGKVSDVKAVKTIPGAPQYSEEAIRVMKSTSGMWTPAKMKGRSVRFSMIQPVRFVMK